MIIICIMCIFFLSDFISTDYVYFFLLSYLPMNYVYFFISGFISTDYVYFFPIWYPFYGLYVLSF